MSFNADALTLTLLAVLAALIIGILVYAATVQLKTRRANRNAMGIRVTLIEYFRRSGVEVSADVFSLDGEHYTAVVESEPMKRFRLSHIIEMTLREHVRKSCGLELDKVYWRFPIKEATQVVTMPTAADGMLPEAQSDDRKPDETSDEYINEGLENYRHIPKPEVTELSWETFEQMATVNRDKPDAK